VVPAAVEHRWADIKVEMEHIVSHDILTPPATESQEPAPQPVRAIDAIDYDLGRRQRRRGVYVLAWATVAFFALAIGTSYAVAIAHGYGTGFGDGREILSRVVPWHGTGFWGDLGLLAGTAVTDVIALYIWYYAASRLDNITKDDPVAPDDEDVDLNEPASWYVVQVPTLTKVLTVVAVVCLIGIVVGAAALLPVVTIRYGFVI
jgi:hypothetical protein